MADTRLPTPDELMLKLGAYNLAGPGVTRNEIIAEMRAAFTTLYEAATRAQEVASPPACEIIAPPNKSGLAYCETHSIWLDHDGKCQGAVARPDETPTRHDPKLREPLRWDEIEQFKLGAPMSGAIRHRICNMAQEEARRIDSSARAPSSPLATTATLIENATQLMKRDEPFLLDKEPKWLAGRIIDLEGAVRVLVEALRGAARGAGTTDAERLDFFDAQRLRVNTYLSLDSGERGFDVGNDEIDGSGATIREAIDNARAACSGRADASSSTHLGATNEDR